MTQVGIPYQGNEDGNFGVSGNDPMNKYQTGANNDPSSNGLNRFDKNILGGTGYRPYLQGGSKFRATGAGPYCAYESINGADKASECKTVEVTLSPKIINYRKLRIFR